MLVERKKIHIAKTKGEQIFNLFGYLFFLGSVIFLAIIAYFIKVKRIT